MIKNPHFQGSLGNSTQSNRWRELGAWKNIHWIQRIGESAGILPDKK
jgi:hypothetical protein